MRKTILIVDDNPLYRQAVKRNLLLRNYHVIEAENATEAMATIERETPQVVVTDLDMRTRTEGLDLIKELQAKRPEIPIILISAVGTFDEGALAKEYGAKYVISKSRVGNEIEHLFKLIERAISHQEKETRLLHQFEQWKDTVEPSQVDNIITQLRNILNDDTLSNYVKSEAIELLYMYSVPSLTAETKSALYQAQQLQTTVTLPQQVERDIEKVFSQFPELQEESKENIRTAEFLYRYQTEFETGYDFTRSIGFSYCFAVENETKHKFRYKLPKFLRSATLRDLLQKLYDARLKNIDLFFYQYIMRLQQNKSLDFQVDKIKLVFEKMLQHGERYKPDGLKAMGIIIFCFGREYQAPTTHGAVDIYNPLGLKGLANEDEILQLAHELIKLQHFRNPYIHPEITARQKITIIRDSALKCLEYVSKLQE
ncbi:MAG: response regulator [bacterium]|nr:response regulator [bacterium]